jgi:hypothetical protein
MLPVRFRRFGKRDRPFQCGIFEIDMQIGTTSVNRTIIT